MTRQSAGKKTLPWMKGKGNFPTSEGSTLIFRSTSKAIYTTSNHLIFFSPSKRNNLPPSNAKRGTFLFTLFFPLLHAILNTDRIQQLKRCGCVQGGREARKIERKTQKWSGWWRTGKDSTGVICGWRVHEKVGALKRRPLGGSDGVGVGVDRNRKR